MAQKNAADSEAVEKSERAKKIKRDQYIADMSFLLGDPRGRRVIWELLERGGVFRISFTGNSETFFNEGKRQIALSLLEDVMESRPDAYLQMSKEAKEGEKNG